MICENVMEGKLVKIRSVTVNDAGFILNVRKDKTLCQYIHNVDISIEEERAWIEEHRALSNDYFFIIENRKQCPIGMVGFIGEVNGVEGEVCRLVSYGNGPQNVETNLLMHDFAFEIMHVEKLTGYMRFDNKKIISMQKKFGYTISEETCMKDGMEIVHANLERSDYYLRRNRIVNMIEKAASFR